MKNLCQFAVLMIIFTNAALGQSNSEWENFPQTLTFNFATTDGSSGVEVPVVSFVPLKARSLEVSVVTTSAR